MATTFDVIINHADADETYAAQAAQAVFQEIARLEDELSRFRASSDIYRLGQLKAGESILVGMAAWDCLSLAKAMHQETNGAFDITIGPLMSLFITHEGEPRQVSKDVLDQARQIIGSNRFARKIQMRFQHEDSKIERVKKLKTRPLAAITRSPEISSK